MSNAELALLLFIILTVGHYAVVWSIYLEKQLVSIRNKSNLLQLLVLNFLQKFMYCRDLYHFSFESGFFFCNLKLLYLEQL